MTGTEPVTETQDQDQLKELLETLGDLDPDPLQHAEEIRRRREALAEDDPALLWDLDRMELRFLVQQARRPDADPAVQSNVARTRHLGLELMRRSIAATPPDHASALFDLAELRAELLHEGMNEEAERARADQLERLQTIEDSDRVASEARERYAAIVTDEEDLDLPHRILLMQETCWVVRELANRDDGNGKLFRKVAKRLDRAIGDRGLAVRMEKVLTRRGVVILENTSLFLLIVVFVLLAIQGLVAFDPTTDKDTIRNFVVVDGCICLFFIFEFLFKLALAPHRTSWFLRNALVDLLPAIPAAILLAEVSVVAGAADAVYVRALRFFRVVAIARYVHTIRPLIAFFRLLLFLVRGLDSVVKRFSPLLNRNFYFFEGGVVRLGEQPEEPGRREVLFRAIRREHVLISEHAANDVADVLQARSDALRDRRASAAVVPTKTVRMEEEVRDVPVEEAIDRLHTMRPEELNLLLPSADLRALDRVVRIMNAPIIRSMPFVRWFRSSRMGSTPESRVTDFGRRIADQLEMWRGRVLFFADLQGIVTGPQILDRVATAMVKASQRPAVRLLLFGLLFSIFRMLLGENSEVGNFLKRFVATPLVVIGGVCLVILFIGRWLKRLAGEAAENLKRTSEAHFINLLELMKSRTRDQDMAFLARRIFRWEMEHWEAALALNRQVQEAATGGVKEGEYEGPDPEPPIQDDINRVALLYLHFLDGAILHESDIKTTEQLLANLSLENIRNHHLRFTRKDRKRIRKLSLGGGTILSGPYLWFRFITESVALETAKRITEYNRHCLSLQQQAVASKEDIEALHTWLKDRESETEGRILEPVAPPHKGAAFKTTEFNALNFLSLDPHRDERVEKIFGPQVLAVLRKDRRNMIREIFGSKPLHKLPRSKRTVNFYVFYQRKLSRGRVLLMPLIFLMLMFKFGRMIGSKTTSIVREILNPELSAATRETSHASFAVALRKIHRMKAPGLLEAMKIRSLFDPAYCGAPPSWSFGMKVEDPPELEQDMDFLQLRERNRQTMREIAGANRRRVEQLHRKVEELHLPEPESRMDQRLGERAVTIAYMTDREGMRSLFRAQAWLERELPKLERWDTRIQGSWIGSLLAAGRRGFRAHPVDRLMATHLVGRNISRRGRRNLRRAYFHDLDGARGIVHAWLALPDGVGPMDQARKLAAQFYRAHGEVSRELVALRAVQTLSVLDVRNYRETVFHLGGFADEGEDPELATALP